ncbi:MAG: ubiquinol-cytochrome c reductase iron-sulfur subunit [Spirosomaceae bacterium]|jgi:cytochrome b6-f complex iron-sulfur subunit|nr:ubiquinol-cytochrome c reductase iron-sulfur subunit [Spirosomataceae bacterium]
MKSTQETAPQTMDRADFFKLVGVSVGAVILQHCLSGCSGGSDDPAPAGTSINLNNADFAALKNPGGVVYNNGIIIARTLQNSFLAVSQACTHQGTRVNFNANANTFVCPNHGSIFNNLGEVVQGPATRPLTRYMTTFDPSTGELKVLM